MSAFPSYNIATININTITNTTKLDALRTFIRTMDLDVVFLQEVENEQLSLPGYNVVCNVDHARRGTAIALKEYIRYSHVEKSLDGRLIALQINDTTLCNIYAPSGTALRAMRESFFNNTLAYYLRRRTTHTILAGDFNCVIRQCDATGNNMSPALLTAVRELQLQDAWVQLNPRSEGHTYITHNSESRLDRLYVSSNLRSYLRAADTHVCSFSDHKAVTFRICLPHQGRTTGGSFWSLRPHLLTPENITEFQNRWQYWTRQRRNFLSWIHWWTEFAKPQIKKFFRWKSREVYEHFHNQHQQLYSQLRAAYDGYYQNPTMLTTINRIKGEMLALQRRFSQFFIRINETHIAGEPMSIYQLGERRRKRTAISHLRNDADEVIEDAERIEEHLLRYFSDLYAEDEAPRAVTENFQCDQIIPLNDPVNDASMNEITTAEIFAAIRSSASRKSPGPDGIPKEFYQRLFDVIHRELNLILNEALQGNFPAQFVDGVIVLVKKKGTGNTAKDYRPISLLNVDYKIFSRILKARLESIMSTHQILSGSQKCSNAERNIFQATLSLKDRIAQLIARKQRAKLISFDLDHAFDRVRVDFLHRTMCSLGINERFVDLLGCIANRSSSRLLVNGHLSPVFPIQRSVRQGDPLSMHLFVLYLHPLVSRLERVCEGDLLVAYADDISVVTTCVRKIEAMRELFSQFEPTSGAMLNVGKTVSIDIGFIDNSPLTVPWLRTENKIKILGVLYANSIRLMVKLNWDLQVTKFAQLIFLHSMRTLTLHQKVTLLNTFITSKIWYLSATLQPQTVHIGKLTATMGTFLWRGVPARIPLHQLARRWEHGGLKLQLPALKCKSLLMNRHLAEIESIPFYKSYLDLANPIPPADCPCLKTILQIYSRLPLPLQQNPSADLIHRYFVDQTEIPKVEQADQAADWPRIWKNIASKRIDSAARSGLYILVNGKTTHRRLMHRIGRADNGNCEHCIAVIETLQHKFSECPRVAPAWAYFQRRLTPYRNGWHPLHFEDLIKPALHNIGPTRRKKILILYNGYINYINSNNGRIDINDLEFYLTSEVNAIM